MRSSSEPQKIFNELIMTNAQLEVQVSNNNSVRATLKVTKIILKNVFYDIVVSKFESTCDTIP